MIKKIKHSVIYRAVKGAVRIQNIILIRLLTSYRLLPKGCEKHKCKPSLSV